MRCESCGLSRSKTRRARRRLHGGGKMWIGRFVTVLLHRMENRNLQLGKGNLIPVPGSVLMGRTTLNSKRSPPAIPSPTPEPLDARASNRISKHLPHLPPPYSPTAARPDEAKQHPSLAASTADHSHSMAWQEDSNNTSGSAPQEPPPTRRDRFQSSSFSKTLSRPHRASPVERHSIGYGQGGNTEPPREWRNQWNPAGQVLILFPSFFLGNWPCWNHNSRISPCPVLQTQPNLALYQPQTD